jgi:hypothetical protein
MLCLIFLLFNFSNSSCKTNLIYNLVIFNCLNSPSKFVGDLFTIYIASILTFPVTTSLEWIQWISIVKLKAQ